jgi:hypothetical protein
MVFSLASVGIALVEEKMLAALCDWALILLFSAFD